MSVMLYLGPWTPVLYPSSAKWVTSTPCYLPTVSAMSPCPSGGDLSSAIRPSRFLASFCPLPTGGPDLKDLCKWPGCPSHSVCPLQLPATLEQGPWSLHIIQLLLLLLSLLCHKLRMRLPQDSIYSKPGLHVCLLSQAVCEGKAPKPPMSPTHPSLAPSPTAARRGSHSPA